MTDQGTFEEPNSDDFLSPEEAHVHRMAQRLEGGTKRSVEKRFGAEFAKDLIAPMEPMSSFDPPSDDPIASIRGLGDKVKRQPNPTNWSIHTVAELVRFRDEINRTLPPTELSKLNLEEEVLLQYHVLRELQSDVLSEEDVPANQRAQVANSVASILKTLGDQQVAVFTSERFKEIENLLIRTLSLFPEDVAAKFMKEYEQILRNSARK